MHILHKNNSKFSMHDGFFFVFSELAASQHDDSTRSDVKQVENDKTDSFKTSTRKYINKNNFVLLEMTRVNTNFRFKGTHARHI